LQHLGKISEERVIQFYFSTVFISEALEFMMWKMVCYPYTEMLMRVLRVYGMPLMFHKHARHASLYKDNTPFSTS